MDDRDKNLTIKKSNLLHMDDYQKRNQADKVKLGDKKRSNENSRRKNRDEKADERPNVGDEKRPA